MAWGSISLFAGFLEKENSLETLIAIFENVSRKSFFWLIMKNFEISVLTANSRYLQTAALKNSTLGKVASIWRIERFQINAIKFDRTQIHFFSVMFSLPSLS